MKTSTPFWGTGKASRKRKRSVSKLKIRWHLLGLQDPACAASTPSIKDIRCEIISMASRGLGQGARSRSDVKGASGRSGADATLSTRKRRRGATE